LLDSAGTLGVRAPKRTDEEMEYDSVTVSGGRWRLHCLSRDENRRAYKRLISGEPTNYRVVHTSPEPLQIGSGWRRRGRGGSKRRNEKEGRKKRPRLGGRLSGTTSVTVAKNAVRQKIMCIVCVVRAVPSLTRQQQGLFT
jgi:hypothetical protein